MRIVNEGGFSDQYTQEISRLTKELARRLNLPVTDLYFRQRSDDTKLTEMATGAHAYLVIIGDYHFDMEYRRSKSKRGGKRGEVFLYTDEKTLKQSEEWKRGSVQHALCQCKDTSEGLYKTNITFPSIGIFPEDVNQSIPFYEMFNAYRGYMSSRRHIHTFGLEDYLKFHKHGILHSYQEWIMNSRKQLNKTTISKQ